MQPLTSGAPLQGLQPVTLRHISSMQSGWKLSELQNRSDAQSKVAQPSVSLAADLAASIAAPSSTYCRLHPPSQAFQNSASAGECTAPPAAFGTLHCALSALHSETSVIGVVLMSGLKVWNS